MALASPAACSLAIAAVLPSPGTQYVSLYSGSPGTTGANELTTVTPVLFPASTPSGASVVSNTASVSVVNAGTQSVTYIGIKTASAGTFVIGAALTSPVTATTVVFAVGAMTFLAS